MLYKKSVKNFLSTKYSNQHYFSIQTSFDGKEYICNTCNSKVKQGKVPCQAVINNMYVDDTPVELASLEKLEQILIAQRGVSEKIIVMPKGQQRKVKGAICNVPVECDQTSSLLPRPPESWYNPVKTQKKVSIQRSCILSILSSSKASLCLTSLAMA